MNSNSTVSADSPLSHVVEQRIRNLIIEYVKMVSEYKVGKMPGLTEVICMWRDIVIPSNRHQFQAPVYTLNEEMALHSVEEAWNAFSNAVTDNMLEKESIGLAIPEWATFAEASTRALHVLMERGKLPED